MLLLFWKPLVTGPLAVPPPLVTDTFDLSYLIVEFFNIGDFGEPRTMEEIDERIYFVGDIKEFRASGITKDGQPWPLTGATLKLVRPNADGTTTVLSRPATNLNSTTWYYATIASDLSTGGIWRRYWVVTDGSSTDTFGYSAFVVKNVT